MTSIAYILNYLQEKSSDESVLFVQSIFRTNDTLRMKIQTYLEGRNAYIPVEEFDHVRDILIRSYDSFLLHNVHRYQYISNMLKRRGQFTCQYLYRWFECFLCETDEVWINYEELTRQWTQCFVHDKNIFPEIIEKIDSLVELWTKAAPNNEQRLTFFLNHMVAQCLQQGTIINGS